MLEEQLAFYLEKYLGAYINGLSKEALKFSVWQGDVELTNMQLKPEALNALKLPIKVKAGFLGSVRLKVPWSRLGQEPVVVELDRIFILAEPATNVKGGDGDSVQEAKSRRVREEEEKLLRSKAEPTRKAEEESNSSWLGSLIGTVIGNLKLSITNIHIRYEDEESNAGHPFAVGLTLAKLAAVTVDEDGKETFVTGGALDRVQKSGELNRLSFYFDADTKAWPMEKSWDEIVPQDWSKVFLPGIAEEPSAYGREKPPWIADHQYVLEPVGGTARYFKLGQKDTPSPDKPAHKAIAILDDVTISLTEEQYRDVIKLAENISAFSKRVQYAHYRPSRSIQEDTKGWWHYAYTAVLEDQKKTSGHLSWHQILFYSRIRKQYLSKYVEALQSNPKATSINDNKDIMELDRQLDSEIIIQWRMLAHAFVDQERKKGEERVKRSWWSFTWGGVDDNDAGSKEFTDNDWRRIDYDIGYEQGAPAPIAPAADQPNMLHAVVEVYMRHNGTKLVSANGESILALTAEGLRCGIKLYPETKVFSVGLNSYKIAAPEGLLGESAHEENSLYGTFILSPWDKQLDWSLEAKAAPCYVTVRLQSLQRISQFFSSKEAVSRDVALQTAAALQSTVNEVSKNAQQQLHDALKNKPKFLLDLDIAAPKVTIPTDFYPDGQHKCKMFLDLGYLNINTLPENGPIDDLSEEHQLYMRFRIRLKDISAFLVDGDYDWRKQYNVNPETGRLHVVNDHVLYQPDSVESLKNRGDKDTGASEGKRDDDGGLFFLPMLEKTGITVALEQICVPHPNYPTTRVAVRLQSLGFQFSPARYHRIMQVFGIFGDESNEEDTRSAFRPWDSPDFNGQMSVLSWTGVGHREAKWESRYGALAGPFFYLLESESSRSYKTFHSLIGKKVFNLPKESLGGVENVIAICDAGQIVSKVAESAGALLLRFVDEYARNKWQERFSRAIYRASSPVAVAGCLGGRAQNDDTEENIPVSPDTGQTKLTEQETIFFTGVLDELKIVMSNSRDIELTSQKMLLAPEKPLLEFRAIGTKVQLVVSKNQMLVGAVLQSLEIEDKFHGHVSYSCRYLARSYIKKKRKEQHHESSRPTSPHEHTHLENLEDQKLKDKRSEVLINRSGNNSRNPGMSKPMLSRYNSSGDEHFFDAYDESDYESSSSTFSLHTRDSSSDLAVKFYDAIDGEADNHEPPSFKREVGLLPGSASPDRSKSDHDVTDIEDRESFVKAQVIMTSPESRTYASIDNEVRISLSALSFNCNRPTIIAALDLVSALTAEFQPKKNEESPFTVGDRKVDAPRSRNKEIKSAPGPLDIDNKDKNEVNQDADRNKVIYQEESQSMPVNADVIVTAIDPKFVEDVDETGNVKLPPKEEESVVKGLLGKGKNRMVLLLVLDMEHAEVVLNKEDGSQLSTLSQDNFHTDVKIYPESWGVNAVLGNLRVTDDNATDHHGRDIPYQYICDMRDPGGSSFIELEFVSFNEDDLDYEGYDFSVTGKLSEVRLVFLNRFIQEIIAYFMGLVPQTSGYVMKLKDRASDYEKLFSQSEIEGQPSLKLDISLSKPIIIMPRGTYSTDFMELDILHINIRSSSEWTGGGKEQLGAIHLETIKLDIEDVSLNIGVGNVIGNEIFDRARGIGLVVRRPLRDLWHEVPSIEGTVKIEELRASLSDKEYQVITECVTQNMAEVPDLPPTLYENESLEGGAPELAGEDANGADVVTEDLESEDNEGHGRRSSPIEKPYTTIKVGVGIDLVELRLFIGGARDASLATVQVIGAWVSYKGNNVEESVFMASLERLSLKDEREGTDPEMQYMIGHADDQAPSSLGDDLHHFRRNRENKTEDETAAGSSNTSPGSGLTMLVVDAKLCPTKQEIFLRIQRPRVVVAFDFLLAVGEFFVPSMHTMLAEKGEEDPLDMKNGIFLNDHVFKQKVREVRISPKKPLVADYEGIQEYTYDGQGNTLRLLNRHDEDLAMVSPETLIFVGDGKRLVFRNVIVQNGVCLDSSLYLGSNSSYSASRNDGVFLEGPPEEFDSSSIGSSHLADRKDIEEVNKLPVEIVFDLQAIGPELTLYDSTNRSSEVPVLSESYLRATMNVFARFSTKGDDMELSANVNGFTVESTSGVRVLEPFDAQVAYSLMTGTQNIRLGTTDINTNFSFSILQLILLLQDDFMSIMRITSEQVTIQCSEFEKIWVHDDSEIAAGGLHLAFWHPRPPPGFAVLGDCVTPMNKPPAKAVLTVNMALVHGKRPLGFKRVWSSIEFAHEVSQKTPIGGRAIHLNDSSKVEMGNPMLCIPDAEVRGEQGCCIWLPIPPEGYVALGCVVWKGQDEPPKSAALCILAALTSPCSMRDCINVLGSRETSGSGAQEQWAFWRADSSIGTFFLQNDRKESIQPQAYDLRLSTSNYEFTTLQETAPSSAKPQMRLPHTLSSIGEEAADTAGILTAVISSGRIFENVGTFKLIWWDKGSGSTDGISIWRPNVPSGCAMLGDLAVKGYDPPVTGLVLRDTEEGGLFSKPERFQELARISKQRHVNGVYFWNPVPPPGYSAIGCIAGKSSRPDKDVMRSIRCVRNDLVSHANFSESSPWSTKYLKSGQQPMSIWLVENEAQTFLVKPGSYGSPSPQGALGLIALRRQAEPDNLAVTVEIKSVSAKFYDDFGGFMTPLLDVSITSLLTSLHGRMEAFCSEVIFSLTVTTYNTKFDLWEPLIETCDAIVRYKQDSDPQARDQPKISRVRIEIPRARPEISTDFNVNISVANANMLLEAYSSWMHLSNSEAWAKKREIQDDIAKSQNSSRRFFKLISDGPLDRKGNKSSYILAHNEIGEQLWLRTVERSGKYQVLSLPPNGTSIVKLPDTYSSKDSIDRELVRGLSGKFVAIRISDAELPHAQGIGGREYMAAIRVVPVNLASNNRRLQFQSARTRCVNPSAKSSTDQVRVIWDEVFVFEVQSGEVNRAQIVVTDLARGSPIGYCSLELSEKGTYGVKKIKSDFACLSSFPLRSETLYPPERDQEEAGLLGEDGESLVEKEHQGRINLAIHIFSAYRDEGDIEDSEDTDSLQDENLQMFGTIEVSATKNGPWSSLRLNYGLGPAPWHLGKDHFASEMVVNDGVKHLFVRSLVTIRNETKYQLEARLCPDFLVDQETDANILDANNSESSLEEELFENQRIQPGKGWGPPTMPAYPGQWCTRDLSRSFKDLTQLSLPDGWVWISDWRLDRTGKVDHDGWGYASDFHAFKGWPPIGNFEKGTMLVRRRRWIRTKLRKDGTKNMVISLGTLEPHCSVACPIGSLRPGGSDYVVQVKPRVGSVNNGVAYNWSSVTSYKDKLELSIARKPTKELRIRGLQNTEELLHCSVLASSSSMDKTDVWLCVECKAIEVGKTSQLDPIEDWRLIISAPLELVNFLPVACSYTVSEKYNGKGLVPIQSGSVKPGESEAIFHADLRNSLYLKWIPEGSWVPKEDDVLISQPGKDPAKRVFVTDGGRDLAIHMQYDSGIRDISAKVIQFHVPCWLDSIGCPSLKYSLVGNHYHGRRSSEKSWLTRKSLEEIVEEDTHRHPIMLSNYDCTTMGLAVALSGSECTQFGPVASLDALADPNGSVDLLVFDGEHSHFKFLVTTTSHPHGFAQTQVVRLRPYTLFTNQLGAPLELRQAGGDESKTLHSWDWQTAFSFQAIQDPLQLQIRLKGSDWSFPFAIDDKEIMDISVRHGNGGRQSVRLDVRGHDAGSQFLAVFQLGSSRGPYRVENRTSQMRLKFRQLGLDESAWRSVRPHSSATFAWEDLQGEKVLEVSQEGSDASQIVRIDLDKLGDHPLFNGNAFVSFNICVRIVESSEAKVVKFFDSEIGTQEYESADNSEIEQLLPTHGATESIQDDQERCYDAPSQTEIALGIGKFGLSIVDQQPRELVFLSMEKVDIVFASGLGDNVSRFTVKVGYMQIDNQLPLTPMPVLLAPELHEEDFVIKAIASMKVETNEAIQVYPYLGLKLTGSAWRINIHEALIWAFLEMFNNLHLDRLSSDSQVVQVDPEIRIETLDMAEVRLKISVYTSPDQRPRGKLGIWGPAFTTLGNISKMPINFRPVFRENRRMRNSQVVTQILNRVTLDLIHQPIQLLLGMDVLGMTSSTLETISRGAASLSKDDDFMRIRANQETARRIKGVKDGVVQGTASFARGVGYGVKGMLTKPIDGAHDRGAVGCIQGVFKALVGIVAEPLSGCLDFMALSVSGIDTSCTNCFEVFDKNQKVERRRLPRAIKGDGVLTRYNSNAAQGLAILQLAQSGGITGRRDVFKHAAIYAFSDFYQDHFHLPKNCILMLTNRRVLMLQSPPSHARERSKELTDPCTVQWEIQWNNLLAMEAANDQNQAEPTQVFLYPRNSTKQFAYVVSCKHPCNSDTPQATQICRAVQQQWRAFCPTPEDPTKAKKSRRLRRRHKLRPLWESGKNSRNSQASSSRSYVEHSDTSGSSRQQWDTQLASTTGDEGFRFEVSLGNLLWSYNKKSNGSCLGFTVADNISFWRPDPPPGYVSVGDVAFTGDYPDNQTVIVYRNDEDKFEKPLGFNLVWRNWKDGSGSPISIWMPIAPDGYLAVGCVVCADYEEPQLDVVWCVHSDLTEDTILEDPAIWKAPSEAPWHCYVYTVASEVRTFIALRQEKNENTPNPRKVIDQIQFY
ncbi:uncharacterized protein [Physcomitrium patens]|uniref:Peroxin/Ferlin domain-containing protein n=1 Tax=Physcomitrium patens TaxID=3218 RepID=A0A2K1IZL1_PHYPA|nr:uncharacterized protein LOC112295539 isoform X2 [Physcomitrium patens]PNR34709.1 hypothetical protein PHYPA_022607 [Physcomitrium patens]|eukprot:XP_024403056.1 uncharacterized protein LOC112295539 isoform X2 [Physcomitrella patens]